MKYFLCALDGASVGIPAWQTEKLISAPQEAADGTEVLVSLPELLRLKDTAAPHAIVLKARASGAASVPKARTVLLTPKVVIDREIPDEAIHALPQALTGRLQYFSGACFIDNAMILILNTDKLTEKKND